MKEFSGEHKHNFSSVLAMFLNKYPVNPRDEVIPSSVVLRAGRVWNKLFARALCVDWASIELKWFGNIPTRQLWPKCNSLFLPKPAPGLMFAIVVSLCARSYTVSSVHVQPSYGLEGVAEWGALGYIPVIPRLWGRWPKNHHNPTHQ